MYDLHDLYDLYDLYELYELYDHVYHMPCVMRKGPLNLVYTWNFKPR